MFIVPCSILIFLITPNTRAEVSPADFIYWTKADISAWHQYFPSRLLEQERLTNVVAAATATKVAEDMETSLAATVRYQAQELQTAQLIMEGTSAQGCVQGISTYMEKAIDEGVSNYEDCAADVVPQLKRLYTSWARTNASYHAAYQKALAGIDGCVRTYPNRDSWSRLRTCVGSWTNNYFTIANSSTSSLSWSPAMGVFLQHVTSCSQMALSGVVMKGWTFLSMLVQCSKLSENIDSEMYEKQLTSEFYKFVTTNDLNFQILNSQYYNRVQVSEVEQEMLHYYDLQKRALEKYVIESRDQGYYYGQMYGYIHKYLSTVAQTAVDNPADADCVSVANAALNDILNAGAEKFLMCDTQIVNNTKLLIARVNNNFLQINNILPSIGNVAILDCMSEGYIFAEKTISNCFSLTLSSFTININGFNANIVADVDVLQGYEKSFFSNSSLPCGNSVLSIFILEADRTLYNLQRCLYINRGTKYAVTTTAPLSTTVAPTTSSASQGTTPTTMPTTTPTTTPTTVSESTPWPTTTPTVTWSMTRY